MVTKKRDNKRPKSRGKNITRRPERVGYCPEEGFDYKAVGLLKKYISDTGKIDSAKRNGLSSKCQRSLTAAVKRARHMALLPFASNHNYDTSLLDIGKRESDNTSNENIDLIKSGPDDEVVEEESVKDDAVSDEVIEDESVKDDAVSDEVVEEESVKDDAVSDDPITEDSEAEDTDKSS